MRRSRESHVGDDAGMGVVSLRRGRQRRRAMALDGAEPTIFAHWEKVLDVPEVQLLSPRGMTSHADRLYVIDSGGDELWRSTVADPTATAEFEEVLTLSSGLGTPAGIDGRMLISSKS